MKAGGLAARESYAAGPAAAVWERTIGRVLRQTASRCPSVEALVSRHQKLRFTWRELLLATEKVAAGLLALGLNPGDRVGVWSTNCAEWVLLQYACALSGIVLVNVNPAYRSHELRFVLQKSAIRILFLHESDARADYRRILAESVEGVNCLLERTIYLGTRDWDVMLAAGERFTDPVIAPGDVANIQYTSGTTGSPKGVLLTHRNLINNGRFIGERLGASEVDRICLPVPLYHCFGCVIGTMVAAATGAAIILPAASFDAGETLQAIQEERATALYGVPTMFIAELSRPDFAQYDLTSLRTGVMAGAPCPIEVMRRVVDEMHCPQITICYGQTESSPVSTMSSIDDSLDVRCTTVGRAMPATEIQIVDPATSAVLPVGEQGELCTRGYLVMKGYDADDEATAKVIDAEGWLHSGDLAIMREDGCFRMTGRLKDMILRGGENIYPREIEEFLYTNPKIAEAQVVGLPDARLGETVLAWVRLKPGESATAEELRAWCKGKIAYFKVPEAIRFVDSFPMTITGKVQKFRIREMEIAERGLDSVSHTPTA
ncbi:MAG: AMP-binding protein [Bryobacterales bacterium]|nr:AMP-binding protein [Bryobacterales bacterium]